RRGGHLLRAVLRVADGVPRQVGRQPGAVERGGQPPAGLPVHLRPAVVRVAGTVAQGQPVRGARGGDGPGAEQAEGGRVPADQPGRRQAGAGRVLVVQHAGGRAGRVVVGTDLPDDARLHLQLLLVGRDDHLPPDAPQGGRGGTGRGGRRGGGAGGAAGP